MTSTSIALPSLIDALVAKRADLITALTTSMHQQNIAHRLCIEIDDMIINTSDTPVLFPSNVFYGLNELLKSNTVSIGAKQARGMTPVLTQGKSESDLRALATHAADQQLWDMLFHKLNITQLMDQASLTAFHSTLQAAPMAFTAEHVFATIESLYEGREAMMIDSLISTVCTADTRYKSNSRFAFGSKIIFKNAIQKTNGVYFSAVRMGDLHNLLRFLSYFTLGDTVKVDVQNSYGVMQDVLFAHVAQTVKAQNSATQVCGQFNIALDDHGLPGCRLDLFKNGNGHLHLSNQMRDYLNSFLSKSKTLRQAA